MSFKDYGLSCYDGMCLVDWNNILEKLGVSVFRVKNFPYKHTITYIVPKHTDHTLAYLLTYLLHGAESFFSS